MISLAIFLIGIYIGSLIDQSNLNDISDDVESISTRVAAVQILLLSDGNESFCPLYTSELDSLDHDIEEVGYKLSFMEDNRKAFDDDLKRRYFVLEAESYLLSKKVKQICGDESALLIHFYSNKDCARCADQGTEVLKARDALEGQGIKVKLFSFDGELDSPVAEAFEAQYGVSGYPTIVIDERTYPGFLDRGEIEALVKGS
ncbi:MAG: hypothetical protein V1827_04910 [Candidatus Micrarchaeota archaeon]